MPAPVLGAFSLILAALSLGLSFAHALEAPPRLRVWPPAFWREATVFKGQYRWFGAVGGPVEAAAVALVGAVAAVDWPAGPWRISLAAALLFLVALGIWLTVVRPANAVMAGWTPGAALADVEPVRRRWESGHIIMAALKLVGFACLAVRASGAAPAA